MLNIYEEEGRSPYWDNIKGLLIALVVVGHFLWAYLGWGWANYIIIFIYFFHMPAFSFVSGFLSKSEKSKSTQSIIKLAAAYLIFNSSMMVFSRILFDASFQLVTPYYSFWFLISLIIWRLTIRYLENKQGIVAVSIIAALLIGFWTDVTMVAAISRTMVFLPFFIIGYKLPADKMIRFIKHRRFIDYFKGLLVLAITVCLSIIFISKYPGFGESNLLMDAYQSWADFLLRILIFSIAALMTFSIAHLTPNRPLPFLCTWGRNSLVIYILHRFITLVFLKFLPANNYQDNYVIFALAASLITLLCLGWEPVSSKVNEFINKARDLIVVKDFNLPLWIAILLTLPVFSVLAGTNTVPEKPVSVVHPVLTSGQEASLNSAVKIAFVGDLILLQDQVRQAYCESSGQYVFDPMFAYAKNYLTEADLAIGVFEGPTAGEAAGYSTSNYDDGIPVKLNYPDSFAPTVKNSGIDLVSTANNHLLDTGRQGALRTLDILDNAGLMHAGSYRNAAEKDSIKIVEVKGIRIAVLAYTLGSNGYSEEYFLKEDPNLTSVLADPKSKYFKQVKANVLSDFAKIKAMENPPDLILVMPHMGTQFIHNTDGCQDAWNDIFTEAGADIILGDHSHAVQSIEYRNSTGTDGEKKQALIVNCPGNFANSYIKNDGDATSIVEVYIDPAKKKVIATGVIPMYTQSPSSGSYRALPIYSILHDANLRSQISTFEMGRVAQVQDIVSSVMLGAKIPMDQAQDRYYLFPEGYYRQTAKAIEITDAMKKSDFYMLLSEAQTICFVGDSITAGSENGGYGWYEPLREAFANSDVFKEAWGGATTFTLLDKAESIAGHSADLYVIAIGTNDVRYRDKARCAMDEQSYINNINSLTSQILRKNPHAKLALISPWLALDNDPYTGISVKERDLMLDKYGEALKLYCDKNGYCFINPNPAIKEYLLKHAPSEYLLDHIHPNASAGIALYSEKSLQIQKD